MGVMQFFHKFCERLDQACGAVCVFCLAAMVLLTGAQIACRLWFTALAWSEELTRYLMVWATFLGAACVYRRMGHISVTVAQGFAPARVRLSMQVFCHIACGVFFLAAALYGLDYMQFQSRQLSAALRIPMSRVYAAIPIGFGIMALHVVDLLARMATARREGGAS